MTSCDHLCHDDDKDVLNEPCLLETRSVLLGACPGTGSCRSGWLLKSETTDLSKSHQDSLLVLFSRRLYSKVLTVGDGKP